MRWAHWLVAAIAFSASFALAERQAAAANHAFVVGINSYSNLPGDKQLQKAVADSYTIRALFAGLNYDVVHLTDTTRANFYDAWDSFLTRIAPNDTAVVFFSGHGVELNGTNYLIPSDIRGLSTDQEVRFRSEAIRFEDLQTDIIERRARISLFIIDACRDNPFVSGTKSLGGRRGLAPVSPAEGTFVMFSAGIGQQALDRLSNFDPHPNSIYTRKLAPLLSTPGLDLVDIARSVREDVRELASTVSHRQNPAYYDETTGKFCPAGCTAAATQSDTSTPPPPVPSVANEQWYLSIYRDVDFFEGDLGPGIPAQTQNACELACEANSDCRMFSYIESQRLCYLKGSLGIPFQNRKAVSGFYRRSLTGLPAEELDIEIRWELRFNTKLTFPTIRWRPTDSTMACAEFCSDYDCPAFTKHPYGGDNCELPSIFADTALGTARSPGAVTGIPQLKRVRPSETRPVQNPNFAGR